MTKFFFFLEKVFSLKSYCTPWGGGGDRGQRAQSGRQLPDNAVHPALQLSFAKTCQAAKRFNCLLISMEPWRAGGSEPGLT